MRLVRGRGAGLSLLLDLMRTWHGHAVQIKSFRYSPKRRNRKSEIVLFKLCSPFKYRERAENVFMRGRIEIEGTDLSASVQHRRLSLS